MRNILDKKLFLEFYSSNFLKFWKISANALYKIFLRIYIIYRTLYTYIYVQVISTKLLMNIFLCWFISRVMQFFLANSTENDW